MPNVQNSSRGTLTKKRIRVAASGDLMFEDYSASTALASANATGLILAGGVKISNKANAVLTGNSTGVVANAGMSFSGKTGKHIKQNSTGIMIGTRYISTNTTGNTTT